MEMECVLASSGKDGGIAMALEKAVSAERKAFIGALKAMYFLNKREVAHTREVAANVSILFPLC